MRPLTIAATVLALLAPVLAAEAQMRPMAPAAPKSPAERHPPQGQKQQQGMMGGMMGPGMMMCPMMGGMMSGMQGRGPGMMGGQGMMSGLGMMGGPVDMSDPKAEARTLKLRGEIMKAVGEVMVKHAEALDKEK